MNTSSIEFNPSLTGWSGLLLVLVLIKLVLYVLDPEIMFFLGDSESYINIAVTGGVPPDRSYYYGLFLAVMTYVSSSLNSLVVSQILMNAVSCFLLAVILVRFFNTSMLIASTAAILCAFEPLQLLFERYVMSETLSLFFFVSFLFLLLSFIKTQAWTSLLLAVIAGFLMIKTRFVFVPVYIFGLCAATGHYSALHFRKLSKPTNNESKRSVLLKMIVPWLIVTFSVFSIHSSTKALQVKYARLPFKEVTGFFLLSAVAPLLEKNTIPFGPNLTETLKNMPCDLSDINVRYAQIYYPDCLTSRLRKSFESEQEANEFAKDAFKYLLLHDPIGVIRLGAATYLRYWDDNALKRAAQYDRGLNIPLSDRFTVLLAQKYGLQAKERQDSSTVTGLYFKAGKPWYKMILIFPLVLVGFAFTFRHHGFPTFVVSAMYCGHLLVVMGLAWITSIRYLHPLSWLVILLAGVCWAQIQQRNISSATK